MRHQIKGLLGFRKGDVGLLGSWHCKEKAGWDWKEKGTPGTQVGPGAPGGAEHRKGLEAGLGEGEQVKKS